MLPVIPALKRLLNVTGTRKWLMASAAAVALAAPAVTQAAPQDRRPGPEHRDAGQRDFGRRDDDRHDYGGRDNDRDRRDYDRRDRDGRIDVDIRLGGGHRPEFEERQVRVWVPPVYRTVVDRKWVEPVYRTECEQVWVPERYEDREVRYQDHGRWCTRIERVVVAPAHYENRDRQVCVTPGHWENCERQELVREGHYEFRSERIRVARTSPFDVVNPSLARFNIQVGK